jgi:hypothetical protein
LSRAQSQFQQDTKLIPWWSYVLAAIFFVGIQLLINLVLAPADPRPRPRAYTAVWALLFGMFLAFYMLMIGFVVRDSKRRGMNPVVWTLIMVSLIPSGLGFIVYFLLREPIALKCPHCAQSVTPDQNFCTQCSFQLKPTCTSCKRALDDDDLFCPQCGTATSPISDRLTANNR